MIVRVRYFVASQVEYRFSSIIWRISGAIFGGVGNVSEDIDKIVKEICFAGGFGPRVTLNKKKNITVRFRFLQ